MTEEMRQVTARGREIEQSSFETIDREAGSHGFDERQWQVVRRVIHATADFEFKELAVFHCDPIAAAARALARGAPIVVDVQMIAAGLNPDRLAVFGSKVYCFISDADVIAEAKAQGLTRAVAAMRRARALLDGGIVAVGNAPTALLEVARMVREEGLRPALAVGVPVGFVNARESKEELLSLAVPAVVTRGRKGGSTIAVAILHALFALAERAGAAASARGPAARAEAGMAESAAAGCAAEAAVSVVGIGNDGPPGLSARAARVIAEAELLCGGERHLGFFPEHRAAKFVIRSNLAELVSAIEDARGRRVVVLASGDPLFFGVGSYLVRRLGKQRVTVMPAPSAMQEAFARIGEPWDDAVLLSVHGRSMDNLVESLRGRRKAAIFTDPVNSPQAIARALLAAGVSGFRAYVCQDLGAPSERVQSFGLDQLAKAEGLSDLNVLILLEESKP
jgi:precorrin-8X/cobalt-precorrin-8 methylmutase